MAVEGHVTDYPMFIDGVSVPSTSGRWIKVCSPATRELVGRVPEGTEAGTSQPSSGHSTHEEAPAEYRRGQLQRFASV